VSVFSPVARTLLGRRGGACVPATLPDRDIRELRIVSVERQGGGHDA
jgi:transcription elongation GreA/GreB family factor